MSLIERMKEQLKKFTRDLNNHERIVITLFAVGIGVIGGYGAILFRMVIHSFENLSFGGHEKLLGVMGQLEFWQRMIPPLLGLTFVAPFVHWLAKEAKGHGVPEVMEAVALRGGRIRPQVFLVKLVASAISIGTGGSVGREGPIVQIGSTAGSIIGQIARVSRRRMRVLVGCGAAAGLAATFNAPIAGVIFSLEILLGEYAVMTMSPIVISSVIATVVSRAHLGNTPAFEIPAELMKFHFASLWEIGTFLVLGFVCAVVGVFFTRLVYFVEDRFDDIHLPVWLKAFFGAVIVSVIIAALPNVAGVGYDSMEALMGNRVADTVQPGFLTSPFTELWLVVLILFIGKMLATSLTLGLGGSGGVFAPSLFVGATTGFLVATVFNLFMPGLISSPGAYALVGMGAMVAATTHASLTSIIILFEMTGDYMIILPVMLACIASTLLATRIDEENIYTKKLSRRGIKLRGGRDEDILQQISVSEIMSTDFLTFDRQDKMKQIVGKILRSHQLYFPVINKDGTLHGLFGYRQIRTFLAQPTLSDIVVAHDLAITDVVTLKKTDSLHSAFILFNSYDIEQMPVVDSQNGQRVLGMVTRRELINAYNKAVLQKGSLLEAQEKIESV